VEKSGHNKYVLTKFMGRSGKVSGSLLLIPCVRERKHGEKRGRREHIDEKEPDVKRKRKRPNQKKMRKLTFGHLGFLTWDRKSCKKHGKEN